MLTKDLSKFIAEEGVVFVLKYIGFDGGGCSGEDDMATMGSTRFSNVVGDIHQNDIFV